MVPEFKDELLDLFVLGADLKACPNCVLRGQLHNAPCQRVIAPGVQALLQDLLAGVCRPVAVGGVERAGPDQESVLGLRD